jgi:hypothetical protein
MQEKSIILFLLLYISPKLICNNVEKDEVIPSPLCPQAFLFYHILVEQDWLPRLCWWLVETGRSARCRSCVRYTFPLEQGK